VSKSLEVTVDEHRGTVRLKITDREVGGRLRGVQRVTVGRGEFERALRDASVVVPWAAVLRPVGQR